MSLFDDFLASDQTIFRDETILDYDYIPETINFRDEEINTIVSSVKPLFFNRLPVNLFIHGIPGIGKTLVVRHVFDDLRSTSNEIVPCYINCWKCQTYHSVFVELSKFFGVPYPSKGVSTEEIIKGITKKTENKKGVVICFDEVDKSKSLDFIYPLVEGFGKKVSIMMISNYSDFLARMDSRLLSRLNLENLSFEKYDYNSFNNILKQRKKYAFYPNVVKEESFKKIVNYSYKSDDVRAGISLLLKSGRIAEKNSSKRIIPDFVDEAINSLQGFKNKNKLSVLKDYEKELLDIIKNNLGSITGELYEIFKEKVKDVSIRTFRKYLNHLETLDLIRTEETSSGFRGKSRKIYTK